MKKNLFYLFALICSMSLFTACNNDDEIFPVDEELTGTYKGDMIISIDKTIYPSVVKKVTISKSGDNQIKIELKDFIFQSMKIGTIVIEHCDLSRSGDAYSFTGNQTLTLEASIGTCSVTVNGTIGLNNIKMNIDVVVGDPLNQTVKVAYTGAKLKGDESSEAKIKSFTFDDASVVEQPVINDETGKITFKVSDAATDDDLKALVPTFTISDKSVVSPASGVAQDFSESKSVTYLVIAADGTEKEYIVSIGGRLNVLKYSFDEWTSVGEGADKHDEPMPKDELASSVEGASLLSIFGVKGFPVFKSNDKVSGDAGIKLVTMDTKEFVNTLVPAVISGSVFTGKFDLEYLDWTTGEKLDCARFGIPYDKKPLRFKGWYKYSPGAKFIDGSDSKNVIETSAVDECAIQAVLFKVENENEVLTGKSINNSPKRVAVAQLTDGTAKSEFTKFDIPFTFLEGKTYEAGAKYKIAIVCSSSKEGDYFKGAGGSTLILDELEVIGE